MPVSTQTIGSSGRYGTINYPMTVVGTNGRYDLITQDLFPVEIWVLTNPWDFRYWMKYIAIGTGRGSSDIDLINEVHRKEAEVVVINNTIHLRATFGQDEPTADDLEIWEVGIFAEIQGGHMGMRWELPNFYSKDNIDELIAECAVTILFG